MKTDQLYAHYMGTKFVRLHSEREGDFFVNVAMIASVNRSRVNTQDGQTEVLLGNGRSFYISTPVSDVMAKIVEHVS